MKDADLDILAIWLKTLIIDTYSRAKARVINLCFRPDAPKTSPDTIRAMLQHYATNMPLDESDSAFQRYIIRSFERSEKMLTNAPIQPDWLVHIQQTLLVMRALLLPLNSSDHMLDVFENQILPLLQPVYDHLSNVSRYRTLDPIISTLWCLGKVAPRHIVLCTPQHVSYIAKCSGITHIMPERFNIYYSNPTLQKLFWKPFLLDSRYFEPTAHAMRTFINDYSIEPPGMRDLPPEFWLAFSYRYVTELADLFNAYIHIHMSLPALARFLLTELWINPDLPPPETIMFFEPFCESIEPAVHNALAHYFATPRPRSPTQTLLQIVRFLENSGRLLLVDHIQRYSTHWHDDPPITSALPTYYVRDVHHLHFVS